MSKVSKETSILQVWIEKWETFFCRVTQFNENLYTTHAITYQYNYWIKPLIFIESQLGEQNIWNLLHVQQVITLISRWTKITVMATSDINVNHPKQVQTNGIHKVIKPLDILCGAEKIDSRRTYVFRNAFHMCPSYIYLKKHTTQYLMLMGDW